jgi:hypothetical protein
VIEECDSKKAAMKLTVPVDDRLLERAREKARREGTSLQEVICGFLADYAGDKSREEIARELTERLRNTSGRSGGRKILRSEAYEGRM